MPISDTPMTYLEFRAIRAQVLRELRLKPTDWIQLLASNIDSAGQPQEFINTSGKQLVTEDNSSTINSKVTESIYYQRMTAPPTFGGLPGDAAGGSYAHYRIMDVTLTATAGGEITSAPIVPALASYKSCCTITHLWSDQTDGSIAMAIATTSGLSYGPSPWNWATTADTVTDYSPGISYKGSAANEAINVSCAAGQAGNAQVIHVLGVFWYEAT